MAWPYCQRTPPPAASPKRRKATHDNPSKRIRPGFVNQRLHEQYCPLLFLGLQMLAPGIVDWEDRTYIEFCLKEVKPNEKGHLDLPDGLDLEP